jgi:predicted SAM-dependent methyltransferase
MAPAHRIKGLANGKIRDIARGSLDRISRRAPGLRSLIEHRDALLKDRDALIAERTALSGQVDQVTQRHHDDVASLQSEVAAVRTELREAEAHLGRVAEAAQSLAAEKKIILAQRDAIQATAHELLLLRNQPRTYLAARFLRGRGIEIGALHRPLTLPDGATVAYVDRMSTDDLRAAYPEWRDLDVVQPSIIDNGETLATVEDESVDFIIANHFLEHCEDPIGTLKVHLQRLRPGGHLFYAIPDKRQTFDKPRDVTTLDHLVADHVDGGRSSRPGHFLDYSTHVWLSQDPQFHADELMATDYSIHFHVWTSSAFLELMSYIQKTYVPTLEIVATQVVEEEFIVIVSK